MSIGERMKNIRTYDLITQEEIANQMGISKKTYGLYENNNALIPLKHLNTFCNYFDISLDYILGFTNIKKYKISNKNINYRLKEFRKENTLSQEELAISLNYNKSTISKYENGISNISLDFLYTICKKYHISADYLLGKIDEPKYLK